MTEKIPDYVEAPAKRLLAKLLEKDSPSRDYVYTVRAIDLSIFREVEDAPVKAHNKYGLTIILKEYPPGPRFCKIFPEKFEGFKSWPIPSVSLEARSRKKSEEEGYVPSYWLQSGPKSRKIRHMPTQCFRTLHRAKKAKEAFVKKYLEESDTNIFSEYVDGVGITGYPNSYYVKVILKKKLPKNPRDFPMFEGLLVGFETDEKIKAFQSLI